MAATTCPIPFAGIDFGDDSNAPIRSYQIEWFDHWLKGTPEETKRFLGRGDMAHYARGDG